MGGTPGGRSDAPFFTRLPEIQVMKVPELTSSPAHPCRPDDDVAQAAHTMAAPRAHRLPAVDGRGKPCGVSSLHDLAVPGHRDTSPGRETVKALVANGPARSGVPAVLTPALATSASAPGRARAIVS
jgi:hypothetical protein